MRITKEWLEEKKACADGMDWFIVQKETDAKKVLRKLLKENHFNWANWAIVRLMKREQYIAYAIYAAEQAIGIFEKQYPDDRRPREAIVAAKAVLKNNNIETRTAAYAAANAAYAAANAAYAAANAANAANAAANVADAAAYAAYAAANAAAYDAVYAAANAAANAAMKKKILEYGIKLIEEKP